MPIRPLLSAALRAALALPALLLGTLLMPLSALAASALHPAQPDKAVFYPNEAELSVSQKLTPQALPSGGHGILLTLPASVKKDTLFVTVDGAPQSGLFWLDEKERAQVIAQSETAPIPGEAALPENEPSPERKALLQRVSDLEQEAATAAGALAAAELRLTLWQKSLDTFGQEESKKSDAISPADEAAKLDSSFSKQLPDIYAERQKQQRHVDDVTRRLNRASLDLRDHDLKAGCEVAVIPSEGSAAQSVTYSYVIPANCNLSYRLDASPDKNQLAIDQDATVSQNSGFVWTNADIYVSTLRRDRALRPANLRAWEIRYEDIAPPMPAAAPMARSMSKERVQAAMPNMAMNVMADEAPDMELSAYGAKPAPVQEEKSTFRIWSLGRQRIENKAPVRLSLAANTVAAKYIYTLRPQSNPKGFLTARLALETPLELSPGMAQFSVDGSPIGRQMFSFNGDKGQIFFGSDPQVTATMRDLKQSGGQQGFFSKDDTLLWHWEITLKSTRSKPVDVVLEDPQPDVKDESIKVKVTSSPKPEEVVNAPEYGGAKIFRWSAPLKPGEPLVVNHKVEVSAPAQKDKELSPGR